jgi:hypothetical protein
MVTAGRLDWLLLHLDAGSTLRIASSYNPGLRRTKVTISVKPGVGPPGSPFMREIIGLLRHSVLNIPVTDAGHRHSNGCSVVNFWLRHPPPDGPLIGGTVRDDDHEEDDSMNDPGAEPENEDDMDVNEDAMAAPQGACPPGDVAGTYLANNYGTLNRIVFSEELEKDMALLRSYSAPEMCYAGLPAGASAETGKDDSLEDCDEDPFVLEGRLSDFCDITTHVYTITYQFAKLHDAVASCDETDLGVNEHLLDNNGQEESIDYSEPAPMERFEMHLSGLRSYLVSLASCFQWHSFDPHDGLCRAHGVDADLVRQAGLTTVTISYEGMIYFWRCPCAASLDMFEQRLWNLFGGTGQIWVGDFDDYDEHELSHLDCCDIADVVRPFTRCT